MSPFDSGTHKREFHFMSKVRECLVMPFKTHQTLFLHLPYLSPTNKRSFNKWPRVIAYMSFWQSTIYLCGEVLTSFHSRGFVFSGITTLDKDKLFVYV